MSKNIETAQRIEQAPGVFVHLDHESMKAFAALAEQTDLQPIEETIISPERAASSVAGASTGGAAGASDLQTKGLIRYGADILTKLGYSQKSLKNLSFYVQTPNPVGGIDVSKEQGYTIAFEDPIDNAGHKKENYDEIVDVISDKETVKQRYREMLRTHGKILDISHFYVSAAIRGIVMEELSQEEEFKNINERVIQVTHFHSSPSFTIRQENPEYYKGHRSSWARENYEIASLRTGITVFSTEKERELTAQAYDGVQGLTYEFIMENSFVSPLTIDTDKPEGSDPIEERKKAREILKLPEDATVFMMVTRLDTEKGYDAFILNWINWAQSKIAGLTDQTQIESIIDQLPYCVVAGGAPLKDPRLVARYKEVYDFIHSNAVDERIRDRIRIPGPMPGKQVFPAADVVFGPSLTESYHMVPKEAGAQQIQSHDPSEGMHGVPVFLSDIAAHQETHGDKAFYFDHLSENGFATAFDAAMDPKLRAHYGRLNAQNTEQFSVEQSTETFLTKLDEVLKRKGQSLN